MFQVREYIVAQGEGESFVSPAQKEARKMIVGLTMIGNGIFSNVYSNNETPFVVKVGSLHDYGYLAYLEMMQELNVQNPYLPHIIDVSFFRNDCEYDPGRYVVRMEKLVNGSYNSSWGITGDTEFAQHCRFIRLGVQDGLFNSEDPRFNSNLNDAVALIQLAFERAKQKTTSVRYDLHCGNFLLRGDQLVITDPLAS